MTPEEREDFYDREIAPALMELAGKCQSNGLSMVAMAEWAPEGSGRTAALVENSSFAIRMAEVAIKSRGNVDSLIMALMKYAGEHGHSSVCLKQLGVPLSNGELPSDV